MSTPLNYEPHRDGVSPTEEQAEAASRRQRQEILEAHLEEKARSVPRTAFESTVLTSRDLPAVAVIEIALRKQGIAARRIHAGQPGEMHICTPTQNLQAAQLIAAEIFARRKRITDALPLSKPEESSTPLRSGDDGGLTALMSADVVHL